MSERVKYVEVDLKKCSLEYGVGACPAVLGEDSGIKCFNTWKTCPVKASFAEETVTVRYSSVSGDLPTGIDAVPNLVSADIRPALLNLGESIGIRASVTFKFKDHRSPDTGPDGDKYLAERPYDPYERGTYWGKFRARQPFLRGQDIRVIFGDSNQSIEQMETRHFIVDNIAGPDSSGNFTIIAKDALKLAEGRRAQAPLVSRGRLLDAISDTDTEFTLNPIGIGDDYPASGVAQIGGNEIVTFTRSGDNVTLTGRGQFNTDASAHDEDDRFQLCLVYTSQKATQIINDLLVNFANVPSSYIPLSSWTTEDDTFIARLYSAVIAEPNSVEQLINELLQQTASTLWWDDRLKLLRFRVLRPVSADAALYDDNVIKQGSFQSVDQPDKRVSQVWTFYGQINPLESLDDQKNYRSALASVDLSSEDNFGGVPAIRQIFSRWIPAFARDAATRLNNLILSRYSVPPRLVTFQLQRSPDLVRPELGGGYQLENWTLQDETGGIDRLEIQAVQVLSNDTTHSVKAEEVLISETVAPDNPNLRTIIIDSDINNINLREIYDAQFPPPDENTTVRFFIEQGVVIGSSSTSLPALQTGLWPETVLSKEIINVGFVLGRGGRGGDANAIAPTGLTPGTANSSSGENGGLALLVTADFDIDNEEGIIGGGGGGGGGAAATSLFQTSVASSGSGAASLGQGGSASAPDMVTQGRTAGVLGGGDRPGTASVTMFFGTSTARGGAGGDLAQPGTSGTASGSITSTSPGGAPGPAVDGDSLINWIELGDIRGARLN